VRYEIREVVFRTPNDGQDHFVADTRFPIVQVLGSPRFDESLDVFITQVLIGPVQ
jgi:hypothetical protein